MTWPVYDLRHLNCLSIKTTPYEHLFHLPILRNG